MALELQLGAEVDRLAFTGLGDFVGTGNELANILTGGAGNDTLDGGLGNDMIVGPRTTRCWNGGADTDTLQVGVNFTSLRSASGDDITGSTVVKLGPEFLEGCRQPTS
jgi:Ca2+-binding RTX toxin-like protein